MKTKRCVKNNVVVQYHMWLAEQNFWWVAAHSKRSHYKNVTLVVSSSCPRCCLSKARASGKLHNCTKLSKRGKQVSDRSARTPRLVLVVASHDNLSVRFLIQQAYISFRDYFTSFLGYYRRFQINSFQQRLILY